MNIDWLIKVYSEPTGEVLGVEENNIGILDTTKTALLHKEKRDRETHPENTLPEVADDAITVFIFNLFGCGGNLAWAPTQFCESTHNKNIN